MRRTGWRVTRLRQFDERECSLKLLTINEVADITGVSRDTIKRRLRSGAFPGATRRGAIGGRSAPWLIPVGDLVAAGFRMVRPVDTDDGQRTEAEVAELDETTRLRLRLVRAAAFCEAQATHIGDLRAQLDRISDLARAAMSGRPAACHACGVLAPEPRPRVDPEPSGV
jgi:predicted DNA-binding transcriptional regulator AlpA